MNKIIIAHQGCKIIERSLVVKSLSLFFFFSKKERHGRRKMAREKLASEGLEVLYMFKILISWLPNPLQRMCSKTSAARGGFPWEKMSPLHFIESRDIAVAAPKTHTAICSLSPLLKHSQLLTISSHHNSRKLSTRKFQLSSWLVVFPAGLNKGVQCDTSNFRGRRGIHICVTQ